MQAVRATIVDAKKNKPELGVTVKFHDTDVEDTYDYELFKDLKFLEGAIIDMEFEDKNRRELRKVETVAFDACF